METSKPLTRISTSALSITCGYFSLLLGCLVLLGWLFDSPLLIQIFQEYVPMQFNTAIAFAVGGGGLLFLNNSKIQRARKTGLVIFCFGSLTLLQYTFNMNLGIDQLFFSHHITIETSHPGRMALNTALCLVLMSLSFLVFTGSKGKVNPMGFLFSGALGGVISSLGLVALIGYMTDLEPAYGWGEHTQMALHTALGFFIHGIGIIAFAWENEAASMVLL